MIDFSGVCDALDQRSPLRRHDATEAIRTALIELRDALCNRLPRERNELVLVNILKTLRMLDVDDQALEDIAEIAGDDRRVIVRAYAISALAGRPPEVGIDFFVARLLAEKSPRVRVEILLALFKAGCEDVIVEIIQLMKSSHHDTQCAAISGLLELDIDNYRDLVTNALRELLEGDAPGPVVSAAQDALETLSHRYCGVCDEAKGSQVTA